MTENEKALKLPGAGQWPDRIAPTVLQAPCCRSAFTGFLGFAGERCAVNGVELIGDEMVTRVLCCPRRSSTSICRWLSSFVALAFAGYWRWLPHDEEPLRHCSKFAMEIALLFVVLTMITGDCGRASNGACGGAGSRG